MIGALLALCLAPDYAWATIPIAAYIFVFVMPLFLIVLVSGVSAWVKYVSARNRVSRESKKLWKGLFVLAILETVLIAFLLSSMRHGISWLDPPEIPALILSYISGDMAVWYFRYATQYVTIPLLVKGLLVIVMFLPHVMLLRNGDEDLKSTMLRGHNAGLAIIMALITPVVFSTFFVLITFEGSTFRSHDLGEAMKSRHPTAHNRKLDATLWRASSKNLPNIVRAIAKRGVKLNARPYGMTTPLMIAAKNGHVAVVRVLMEAGADPCYMYCGESAVSLARSPAIIRLLDPDGSLRKYEELELRIQQGKFAEAKRLVDEGCDINKRNSDGYTILTEAAVTGPPTRVKMLLDLGADINARHSDGTGPLLAAAYAGDLEIVKLLVERGAPIEEKRKTKVTPVMEAGKHGYYAIVRYLISKGADVNALTVHGWSALGYACQHGDVDVVKLLLDNGASVHVRSPAGRTPLSAAKGPHRKLIRELLKKHGATK
jgi:ankyrin repeat protein